MRDLGRIMSENSNNGLVMREAQRRNDWDTVDLLSCGSGYDVSNEQMQEYLNGGSYEDVFNVSFQLIW